METMSLIAPCHFGVEAVLKKEIYDLINEFKSQGKAIIMISSEMPEILGMCDRIYVMNEGKIQQIGSPIDIYNEPKNAFVADFIGESNILDGVMLDDFKRTVQQFYIRRVGRYMEFVRRHAVGKLLLCHLHNLTLLACNLLVLEGEKTAFLFQLFVPLGQLLLLLPQG